MGFWGIEVKPGKPIPYHADNVQGKLHVTQATLGTGSSAEKSILQCSSGHKSPVFLCSLLPNKIESCPLNLEFDDDDLVAFSVIGPRSIHLSGYFVADDGDDLRDDYEYDSFGEDVEGTETEESSEYDSEDGYDFIDDSDVDMYPSSPVPNSGVVIDEIVDEDKPDSGDDPAKQSKKKKRAARLKEKDSKSSQLPIVVRGETPPHNLESEDEDGFPISAAQKSKSESPKEEAQMKEGQARKKTEKANKKAKQVDHSAGLKRKVESANEDEQHQDGKKKKNKKDKLKEHGKGESAHVAGNSNETNVTTPDEKHSEEVKTTLNLNNVSDAKDGQHDGILSNKEVLVEKKNKKKAKESEGVATANEIATNVENKDLSTAEKRGKKNTEDMPSQVRSFPNGLVIEELSMGKPDGKRATPGKKVSVKYIGKLKKDGKIFDSNVGRAPFKFRLGVGQVIKGWEVGVNGMRIGDKRRITVPPSMGIRLLRIGDKRRITVQPSMGYGYKHAGTIPPNSWLVFDVELVNVDG